MEDRFNGLVYHQHFIRTVARVRLEIYHTQALDTVVSVVRNIGPFSGIVLH